MRLRTAVVLLLMSISVASSAQQPRERVLLVYDEQQISDQDRAQLMRVLCFAVPPEEWRLEKAEGAWTLATFVDHYYDYFAKDKESQVDAYPHTSAAIEDAIFTDERNEGKIIDENGVRTVAEGTKLWMPALPVRANWVNEEKLALRTFNPDGNRYGRTDSGEKFPKAATVNKAAATKEHPFRSARMTAIEIPDWSLLKSILRIRADLRIPPNSVRTEIDAEEASVSFLECAPADAKLKASLHSTFASGALDAVRARVKDMIRNNEMKPLWIIDWGCDQEKGHCSKVRAVVYSVLEDLGLPFLANETWVHTFDLNPRPQANAAELLKSVYGLRDFYGGQKKSLQNFDEKTLGRAVTLAEKWIKDAKDDPAPDPGEEEKHAINEFVLQAVMWRFLYNEELWANMSFSTRYPVGQVLDAIFMNSATSFVSVAAGNSKEIFVEPGEYPQEGANLYDNIINVTFGEPDGRVLGSRMKPNTDGKAIEVDLVAPGCGFERGNTIAATDRGSSFASPYVAVMAWIKAMADGVSPKAMKQVLRRATRPAPYEDRMVSTRGVFDPAMLFLPITQEPHMLLSDNTIVPLSKATLTLKYAAVDAGSSSENARTDTIPLGPQYTGGHVAVFRCSTPNEADRYCLWRKDLPGFDPVIWRAYSVRIERKDQDPLDYTAAEFAAKVKDLCF